jgi:hypothetical protein
MTAYLNPDPPPECDHDWRIDPNVMLMSNPPQQRIVCARCGKRSSRVPPGSKRVGGNHNVQSWEKVDPIKDLATMLYLNGSSSG